jgi:hypothetical protein
MPQFWVRVWYEGILIEDHQLTLHDNLRFGELPGSHISFPNTRILLHNFGNQVRMNGRRIFPGDDRFIEREQIKVHIKFLPEESNEYPSWDPSMLVLFVSTVGLSLWFSFGMQAVANSTALPPTGLWGLWQKAEVSDLLPSMLTYSEDSETIYDGPRHEPDDHFTSIRFYDWHRKLQRRDHRHLDAQERLQSNPSDLQAHWIMARYAYSMDDSETALYHLSFLEESTPSSTLYLQIGRSLRRLGRHQEEIVAYDKALALSPGNPVLLGAQSVALARLGRLDDSERFYLQLQRSLEHGAFHYLIEAKLNMIQGRSRHALYSIEEAILHRDNLTDDLKSELYRDIAIDPLLRPLREEWALYDALLLHFGADAPKCTR